VVANAMRVRRWAMFALAAKRAGAPAPSIVSVADVPAAIWRIVLPAECAALPVLRALPERGTLDPAVHAAAFELSLPEVQRCMTAGAQLREIDALCAQHGLRPVVLKGGMNIARGREIDLGDLDIFLPPGEATRFAELVDSGHYQRAPFLDGPKHLARRLASQRLPLEIHHTLRVVADRPEDVFAATVLIPGFETLRALAPADHAWHVLHHCVEAHPRRQGMLRDVLALGVALDLCDGDDMRALQARIDAHQRRDRMMDMLRIAVEVRAGQVTDGPSHRPFDHLAAARYALADRKFERWLRIGPAVYNAAFTTLDPDTRLVDIARLLWPAGRVTRWYAPSQNALLKAATLTAGKISKVVYRACAVSIGASIAAVVSRSIRRAALQSP
jgi:hypothetical protein